MKTYSQDEIIQSLKENGISVTIQRIGILEYLMQVRSHPSVEEIFDAIRKRFPTISKATVYNTLITLRDAGMIQEITIEKDRARYDGDTSPHGHFNCISCGKVYDVGCEFKLKDENFNVESSHVYFYGKCPECSVKKAESL